MRVPYVFVCVGICWLVLVKIYTFVRADFTVKIYPLSGASGVKSGTRIFHHAKQQLRRKICFQPQKKTTGTKENK